MGWFVDYNADTPELVYPLPDGFYAILPEGAVGGEDWQAFGEGLRDEQAVERIAVVVRQGFEVEDVLVADGE